MTIEEQKAALDKVALEINQKLDGATEGIKKGDKVAMLGIGSGLNCLMLGAEW